MPSAVISSNHLAHVRSRIGRTLAYSVGIRARHFLALTTTQSMNQRACANPLPVKKRVNVHGYHLHRSTAFPLGQFVKDTPRNTRKTSSANPFPVRKNKAPYDPWEYLFFDTLPVDTMRCLVSYLDAESRRIVLQPGRRRHGAKNDNPFLTVPSDTFDLLRFGPGSTTDFSVHDRSIWVPRAAKLEEFTRLAMVYGSHIKKVIMGKLTLPFIYVISKWCSGELRELDISYEFVVRGISSHDLNLIELFGILGPKLESLSISAFGIGDNELNLLMHSIRRTN